MVVTDALSADKSWPASQAVEFSDNKTIPGVIRKKCLWSSSISKSEQVHAAIDLAQYIYFIICY